MLFEWNENKRQSNLRKHGIDFVRAKEIWYGEVFEYSSHQRNHGEERLLAVGKSNGKFVTVVFTWRGEIRRLISARLARRYEQEIYQNEIRREP
jgi:uncharacterized DUF497 family protein